jgi:hypothetical protein
MMKRRGILIMMGSEFLLELGCGRSKEETGREVLDRGRKGKWKRKRRGQIDGRN